MLKKVNNSGKNFDTDLHDIDYGLHDEIKKKKLM